LYKKKLPPTEATKDIGTITRLNTGLFRKFILQQLLSLNHHHMRRLGEECTKNSCFIAIARWLSQSRNKVCLWPRIQHTRGGHSL